MAATLGPSAVDTFGEWHSARPDGVDVDGRYRAVLPSTAPGPGEQFRFEVDLDSCTGCKACVSACHSLNGLEESEIWRSVGVLVGGGGESPVWQQHVTTACHHCVEPACLAGCPVDAYEKDPITGIVAHLDDQCIGCRYCQLTCPYEVPTFSSRLGVVRKCDMCSDRLADGEPPACVQGCPTDAISIGIVSVAELTVDGVLGGRGAESESHSLSDGSAVAVRSPVSTRGDAARLVPTAPVSSLTIPSTLYRTTRTMPSDAAAADDHRLVPASNHVPLVAMLTLTQLSVGALVCSVVVDLIGRGVDGAMGSPTTGIIALLTAVSALGASVLHLGRPWVAWRAVLGIGHSWLSREIVLFGAYAAAALAAAAASTGAVAASWSTTMVVAAAVIGTAGVGCSAQLYAVTGRTWWRLDRTSLRFGVTMLSTGGAAVGLATALTAWASDDANGGVTTTMRRSVERSVTVMIVVSVAVGLAASVIFVGRHHDTPGQLGRTAWLLCHPLRHDWMSAVVLALVGVLAALTVEVVHPAPALATLLWLVAAVALVGASWIDRRVFFTAAAPDRMPGGFH